MTEYFSIVTQLQKNLITLFREPIIPLRSERDIKLCNKAKNKIKEGVAIALSLISSN